jgi:hypothetical protein
VSVPRTYIRIGDRDILPQFVSDLETDVSLPLTYQGQRSMSVLVRSVCDCYWMICILIEVVSRLKNHDAKANKLEKVLKPLESPLRLITPSEAEGGEHS